MRANIFKLQLSISAAVFRRGGADDVPGQKQAGQEACQRYSECGSPSSVGFILLHRSRRHNEETARDPDIHQCHQGWWMSSLNALLTRSSACRQSSFSGRCRIKPAASLHIFFFVSTEEKPCQSCPRQATTNQLLLAYKLTKCSEQKTDWWT